jgi:thioredoxin reductase (NADPH)
MAEKPAILVVDDDQAVIFSVARDLQSRYGERFRIIPTDSGASTVDVMNRLKLQGAPVALIIADQRMPGMTGVEVITEAISLYPDIKRVLLTAYADTDVAIRAINDVQIDHYLLKPWDPPEERLFPVVDDVLDDWLATYYPPFEGVRVIGHRWSASTFQLKDFLSRNLIPYHMVDVEHDEDAAELLDRMHLDPGVLPIVVLQDGTTLAQPSQQELAARIGLETRAALPFYDLIIVGAGPSGLAGAVYGASEGLRTLMIERQAPGGQAGTSSRIENYLGFPAGLSGADLARRGLAQAKRLGAEVLSAEVVGIRVEGPYRIVELRDDGEISCHALLVSAGVSYRRLDAPGIERLHGAGVYYGGALSEAIATRDEDVFIVGGANSAGQAAIHFSGYARQVTMIVRGDSLAKSGMSRYLSDRIEQTPNIDVWFNSSVVEAMGSDHLEALRIANNRTGEERTTPADDLFIFIGAKPYTTWIRELVALDGAGYVLTGPDIAKAANDAPRWPLPRDAFLLETSVPGIFAAGDVRHQSVKRIASATGEGAMAIQFVHRYLSTL